jgi:hypothetical protein
VEPNFAPRKFLSIQSIPIGSTSQHDMQIWRGTALGSFTVRSAYHLAKELSTISKAKSSRRLGDMQIRQGIWSLKMANAGKNFMWHACHNLLPTMDNLVRRKIVDDPKCPVCGLEAETIFHILWACQSSMDVWSVGLWLFQKFVSAASDFLLLAEDIFQKSEGNEFAIFVETARKIWFRINKWIHDGLFTAQLCKELDVRNIIIKGDAQTIIQALQTKDQNGSRH